MVSNRPGGANVPPFDALADIRKFAIVRDEFLGGSAGTTGTVGSLDWIVTQIAGDSAPDAPQDVTGYEDHPGVISLNTGPTTPAIADEGGLTLSGAVVLSSNSLTYVGSVVRFPSVTAVEFNFGLFDLSLGAGRDTDSISIELDISALAYFVGNSTAGSATVGTNVSGEQTAAAINTWYTLEVAADDSSAYFWVNGELLGEVKGTNTALPLYPGFKMATEANGEKSVLIDAFVMRQAVNRAGFTGVG